MLMKNDKDVVRTRERQLESQHQGERRAPATQSQMDRMFDDFFRRPFLSSLLSRPGSEHDELYPPVDIYQDAESVVVKAEVPGVRREDLDIQLSPDSITLSGSKSSEDKVEREDFFRVERSSGSFTRRLPLPAECSMEGARASFKDGVLEVRIPKSTESARRVRKLAVE